MTAKRKSSTQDHSSSRLFFYSTLLISLYQVVHGGLTMQWSDTECGASQNSADPDSQQAWAGWGGVGVVGGGYPGGRGCLSGACMQGVIRLTWPVFDTYIMITEMLIMGSKACTYHAYKSIWTDTAFVWNAKLTRLEKGTNRVQYPDRGIISWIFSSQKLKIFRFKKTNCRSHQNTKNEVTFV